MGSTQDDRSSKVAPDDREILYTRSFIFQNVHNRTAYEIVSWIRTFSLEVALIDWRFISNHPLPIGDYSTTDKRQPEEKDL